MPKAPCVKYEKLNEEKHGVFQLDTMFDPNG